MITVLLASGGVCRDLEMLVSSPPVLYYGNSMPRLQIACFDV